MSVMGNETQNTLDGLITRLARLDRALDAALAVRDFPRPRRGRKPSGIKNRRIRKSQPDLLETSSDDVQLVYGVLIAEAGRVPDCSEIESAALTYGQIKERTKLTHDALGLALNELISNLNRLRTRDDGGRRIYFLPGEKRMIIQTKKSRRAAA